MDQEVVWALEIMGKGMFSIFLVIFVLYLIVILLAKVTNMPRFNKDKEEK